jgi:hypothetical protein
MRMAIKVHFSAGETTKRTSALYQWDYGQQLEIESADLPTLVEVHFACPDMSEAIVRVCSVNNGIATVSIPDMCLEQSNPITAWVYEIHDTTGSTTKAVVIPVTARTRPARSETIPQETSDRYTELISEVNEAVDKIKSGEVMVANAAHSTSADRALQADNASSATTAISANFATKAGEAVGYQKADRGGFQSTMYLPNYLKTGNVCQFRVTLNGIDCYTTLVCEAGKTAQASLGWIKGTEEKHYILRVTNGVATVWSLTPGAQSASERTDLTVYFRLI